LIKVEVEWEARVDFLEWEERMQVLDLRGNIFASMRSGWGHGAGSNIFMRKGIWGQVSGDGREQVVGSNDTFPTVWLFGREVVWVQISGEGWEDASDGLEWHHLCPGGHRDVPEQTIEKLERMWVWRSLVTERGCKRWSQATPSLLWAGKGEGIGVGPRFPL